MRGNRKTSAILASAMLAGMLAGCAVGTGGAADDSDTDYSPDAELTGNLQVMGFSGVDAEFTNAMQDAVNSVLNGEATPEDALAKAQETAQKALDAAWSKLEDAED